MLQRMAQKYFANDVFGELWAIPLDDATGTAASATIVVNGPATEPGTLFLYIGGQVVEVAVSDGDTATAIRANIVSAVGAVADLAVTAANGSAVDEVDLTAKNDGTIGNDIDLRANYRGLGGGEAYPDGVSLEVGSADLDGTPAYMSGGATDPSLTNAIAAMADDEYDYIIQPYTSGTVLDAFETELGDRWGALQQVYGHMFSAKRGTQGVLTTFGNGRNDPGATVFGFNKYPNPTEEIAAAAAAQCAKSLKIDPARPLQTLPLLGILPPAKADAFTTTEQNTLLFDGVATTYVVGGKVRVTRSITTYQEDAFGNADASFLDVTTRATLQYILRFLKSRIESKFPRHKLVNDGTNFGAGQAVVSPGTIKAELVAGYMELESAALVENTKAFTKNLIVERNAGDPNRVDVLYPPDLANQLRVMATLMQFRLEG